MDPEIVFKAVFQSLAEVIAYACPIYEKLPLFNKNKGNTGIKLAGKKIAYRPSDEDREAPIDITCQEIWRNKFETLGLLQTTKIISEHCILGNGENSLFLDPWDGTYPWMLGIKEPIYYSVGSIFDIKGKSIIGGCANIAERKILIAHRDQVECFSLNKDFSIHEIYPVYPIKRTRFNAATVIASYLAKGRYYDLTRKRTSGFLEDHRGWRDSSAGSFIPAALASGQNGMVFYALGEEIMSEVLPGWAFAEIAGLRAAIKSADGSWEDFNPRITYYRDNPDAYWKDSVHLFVIATTGELLEQAKKKIG